MNVKQRKQDINSPEQVSPPRIILASASPRRRELLGLTGLPFEVIPAQGEEVITKTEPSEVVRELSLAKALEVAGKAAKTDTGRTIVIGADTIVALQGKILGKPSDREDAFRMIASIAGKEHEVYTGVTVLLLEDGRVTEQNVFSECTRVFVHPMEPEDILAYLETGEADDKAGAYGIQGRFGIWVDRIEGDYNNVVGLPAAALWQTLRRYL